MSLQGGLIGEAFTALSFAGALVAMISFFFAEFRDRTEQGQWENLGVQAFRIHAFSIFGIIGTLFYLIYSHSYGYHYVWAHSSNELPVYYMISCFWEGQEGSFLLWSFWHCVLGLIILKKRSEWRNTVLAVVASVELILSSMILGIYIGQGFVAGLFYLLGLIPAAYLLWRYIKERDKLLQNGQFHLVSLIVAAIYFSLLMQGQYGYQDIFSWGDLFSGGFQGLVFGLCTLFLLLYVGYFLFFLYQSAQEKNIPVFDLIAGLMLMSMAVVLMFYGPDIWKIGSTPFISLKDAFPDNPVYTRQPDFIPTNGTGLNPLLQNYWMVIHPPTLFLGFSSTVIPFAFVMAALIRREYTGWIRSVMPWISFSVMILGIGIIMGGYWAYETLNFGGYWNWDPVENSSFVPWLCGVAALHALLIYRKTKAYLGMTMILITSTFILVLISTFFTRSDILGETSVHAFTDLGLSGQLILLLMVYLVGIIVAFVLRWKEIPQRADESKVWSAEFMLFLGTLVFIFSGAVILLSTSVPVFNKIFGTNFAPPLHVQFMYYQYTIWFAVAFGVLSGLGQFLYWQKVLNKKVKDALFRPFLLAMICGTICLLFTWFGLKEFAYDSFFNDMIDPELHSGFGLILGYIKYFFLSFADELLLFASLFTIFANGDILIALLRKNRKGLKVMGGTVVHIGFGLMLLGMLYSSGYDEVISTNPFPEELALFPDQEKIDNVLLPRHRSRPINGYELTYLGRKHAQAPVRQLNVLESDSEAFKVAFRDAQGERYALVLPLQHFQKESQPVQPTSDISGADMDWKAQVDLEKVEKILNEELAFYAKQINGRTHYGIQFRSMTDPDDQFIRYMETEMNAGQEGIIPHPSRKIYWDHDIYFFTSSLPDPDSLRPKVQAFDMHVGDTVQVPGALVVLNRINPVEKPEYSDYDIAAEASILVIGEDGRRHHATPVYLIKDRTPDNRRFLLEEMEMEFAFMDVKPAENLVTIWISYVDPILDRVVIKAIKKPFINLLWLGTFILTFGFILSIYRRWGEFKKLR